MTNNMKIRKYLENGKLVKIVRRSDKNLSVKSEFFYIRSIFKKNWRLPALSGLSRILSGLCRFLRPARISGSVFDTNRTSRLSRNSSSCLRGVFSGLIVPKTKQPSVSLIGSKE